MIQRHLRPPIWIRTLGLMAMVLVLSAMPVGSAENQDDLDFQAAVRFWLDDNDQVALPALSSLAKSGHAEARTLLALIDKTTVLHGPWVSLLSKKERSNLMRASGGISGVSWLRRVPNSVFAQTWLDVWSTNSSTDAALVFGSLGERRAARTALMFLEARQGTGFSQARADPDYPVEMLYLVWRQWHFEGGRMIKSRRA